MFICLAIVLLIAAGLRIGFAQIVVAQHTAYTFSEIHGDTFGYLRLGERVFDRRPYEEGRALFRNRALVRPPGYPVFYAAARTAYGWLGIDLVERLALIVWPQVALSLLQVAVTFALARIVLRRLVAATAAGLIAAVSPGGVAAAAIAMPDSPFAVFFSLAFLGLVAIVQGKRRPALMSLAGAALAIAALLKPAAIYWPVPVIAVVLFTRGWRGTLTRGVLGDLRRLLLPVVIVVLTWTWFNLWSQQVPTYSIVADRNMRYDVVPKVEFAAKRGRMPTQAEYTRYTSGRGDDAYLRSNNASTSALYSRIRAETSAVLRKHPLTTFRVMLSNLSNQLMTRYKLMHRQMPKRNETTVAIRNLADHTDDRAALLVWYVPMLAAVPLWLGSRRTRRLLVACWVAVLYIALPLVSVESEGSRLLLASEPMSITLVVAGVFGAIKLCRRSLERFQARPVTAAGE